MKKNTKNKMLIICGPPGSGKSTYAKQLFAQEIEQNGGHDPCVINADKMRGQLCGDESDQSKNAYIFNTLIPNLIKDAAKDNMDIIVDNTNYNRKNRKNLIKLGKELGYFIEAHVLVVSREVCKERNANRARHVPDFVIDRQFDGWQDPTLEEGFDSVVFLPQND